MERLGRRLRVVPEEYGVSYRWGAYPYGTAISETYGVGDGDNVGAVGGAFYYELIYRCGIGCAITIYGIAQAVCACITDGGI